MTGVAALGPAGLPLVSVSPGVEVKEVRGWYCLRCAWEARVERPRMSLVARSDGDVVGVVFADEDEVTDAGSQSAKETARPLCRR